MKLIINEDSGILSIQQEFNTMFPFLKLEFFYKLHGRGQLTLLKFPQPPNKLLKEISSKHEKGTITITPEMSVSNLEQLFKQIYGIDIRIYRKSGKSWIETVFTDNWSLHKQNEEGAFLSTPIPPEVPTDDHKQE